MIMSSTNNITGDRLRSRPSTDAFRNSSFWETRRLSPLPYVQEMKANARKEKDSEKEEKKL